MSYARWSFSNWYVWADVRGELACFHLSAGQGFYKYNSDVDEFIKDTFKGLSKSDERELRNIIEEANEDYNEEHKND